MADEELLKAIAELKEEVKNLRETVAILLNLVVGMRAEDEEEAMPLDAHKENKFSIYR